jgi:hypothetical protein
MFSAIITDLYTQPRRCRVSDLSALILSVSCHGAGFSYGPVFRRRHRGALC